MKRNRLVTCKTMDWDQQENGGPEDKVDITSPNFPQKICDIPYLFRPPVGLQ